MQLFKLLLGIILLSLAFPQSTAVSTSSVTFQVLNYDQTTGQLVPVHFATVWVCTVYLRQPHGVYNACPNTGFTNSSGMYTTSRVVGSRSWYVAVYPQPRNGTMVGCQVTGEIWFPTTAGANGIQRVIASCN